MTTIEAFTQLIESDNIKINASTKRVIRMRLKLKKSISLDLMEKHLLKAGYKKKPESWKR